MFRAKDWLRRAGARLDLKGGLKGGEKRSRMRELPLRQRHGRLPKRCTLRAASRIQTATNKLNEQKTTHRVEEQALELLLAQRLGQVAHAQARARHHKVGALQLQALLGERRLALGAVACAQLAPRRRALSDRALLCLLQC